MGSVNLYIFHELSPFDEIAEVNCIYFDLLLCAKYFTFVICCRVSTCISTYISTYVNLSQLYISTSIVVIPSVVIKRPVLFTPEPTALLFNHIHNTRLLQNGAHVGTRRRETTHHYDG